MTPDKVEAALASFAALIEKKRRQADMSDHPKANEYGRGAASAMRVVSDEMADELMSLTSVLTEALAEMEWRPIDSAPKSLQEIFELYPNGFGTTVLIARCDEAIPGELAVISGCVAEATLLEDGRWASPMPPGFPNTGDGWIEIVNPTHWKPMPSQPAMKETP